MTKLQVIPFFLLVLLVFGCSGPVGPFSGGRLAGDTAPFPTTWDVAVEADHVQLETYDADGDAHSVNIWCVVHMDRLFFTTSLVRGEEQPDKRRWVQNALANPAARLKVDTYIFEGIISKVEDAEFLSNVKNAFVLKYDEENDERARDAWVFEFAKPQT